MTDDDDLGQIRRLWSQVRTTGLTDPARLTPLQMRAKADMLACAARELRAAADRLDRDSSSP